MNPIKEKIPAFIAKFVARASLWFKLEESIDLFDQSSPQKKFT